MKSKKYNLPQWILPVLILVLVAFVTIGSSPLFLTNSWVDSNAMLTMGKSMLHGLVPYRDMIDQRGPLLYALFGLGSTIKDDSFLGVFCLQVINVLIIYYLSFRIAQDAKIKLITPQWAGLLGPLALISTSAFNLSGSPEEFAFTSVLYLLYVLNHYRQDVSQITLTSYFFLGLNVSIIFWNKFSLLGSYGMFFLWVVGSMLFQKKFKQLFKILVVSLAGFLSVTFFVAIYFIGRNALNDLIQIYFVQNLTDYGNTHQSELMKIWNLFFNMGQELRGHFIVALLIVAGWLKALYEKKNVAAEILMFFGAILFVSMQHLLNDYYNLIWMPFLVVALMRLVQFKVPKLDFENRHLFRAINILLVGSLFILPFVNNNLYLSKLVLQGEHESFNDEQYQAQPKFAKIMKQTNQHPTLLMANCLDEGFYLAANTLPSTRYWQRLNMTYKQLPKMYHYFAKVMDQRKVDFIIVKLDSMPEKSKNLLQGQVSDAVEKHIAKPLLKNYRIRSVAHNNTNESYVLLEKK